MNGGMYTEERSPVGLFIKEGKIIKTVNKSKGTGNFYLQPNGIFYITNDGRTFAVVALPATDPVATNWSVRPFSRISGWTLVCRGDTAAPPAGQCKEIVMVQDQDGHYPGPWF